MIDVIPVYIGYDPREAVAWHVCVQSIIDTARDPDRLEFHVVRGERRDGSNDFVYARFLVPYLSGFRGHALFLDGDMILRAPIEDLWDQRAISHVGVQVVKHDYKTKFPVKYLGAKNEDYEKKNWSSVMLWNCAYLPNHCLTPDMLERVDGRWLHRFAWLRADQVGDLDPTWNHLTMEYTPNPDAKLYHYTIGTPCFPEYAYQEGGDEWWNHYGRAVAPIQT